jgi:hypothetical protein
MRREEPFHPQHGIALGRGQALISLSAGTSATQKLPNDLKVLLNFFDELRRKVPAGK